MTTTVPTPSPQLTDDLEYQLPAVDNPAILGEHQGKYLNAIVFDNEYLMWDFMKKLDERTREMLNRSALFQNSDRTERTRIIFVSIDSLLSHPFYGVYHDGAMILSKQIIACPTNKGGSK